MPHSMGKGSRALAIHLPPNRLLWTVSAGAEKNVKTVLTKDDKEKLLNTLRELGLLPPLQGQIIINITPQTGISAIDYKISLR